MACMGCCRNLNLHKLRGGRASAPSMIRASRWCWGRRQLPGSFQGLLHFKSWAIWESFRLLGLAGGSYWACIRCKVILGAVYYPGDAARALQLVRLSSFNAGKANIASRSASWQYRGPSLKPQASGLGAPGRIEPDLFLMTPQLVET